VRTTRPGLRLVAFLAFVASSAAVARLEAGSHLWKINELFSSADGTVQFIELHECCGATGEIFMRGLEVTSLATGSVFRFPETLTAPTSRRYLLLATDAFAALPGAPEPDYTLPARFFDPNGDTIWYSQARNYDRFVFSRGDLPVDGINSIHVTDYVSDVFTTGVNSPANYSGETGSVDASSSPTDDSFVRGDCNADGDTDISDAAFLLNALFLAPKALSCEDACDSNDDGALDIADPIAVLTWLFQGGSALPEPQACGGDPAGDSLACADFEQCS
jgi:hypothetical protein